MNAQRSETEFVDGLRVYAPHERAPDYIIANATIDNTTLCAWLSAHPGQVRIVIKRSQGGKYYAAVDTYKRDAEQPSRAPVKDRPQPDQGNAVDASNGDPFGDDIPFMPRGKRAHWIA